MKIAPVILNPWLSPASSPRAARWRRPEAVDWPEACLGPCAPESGGSGSGRCHSSASGLRAGPYQHWCSSGTGTRVGTAMCAEGEERMRERERERVSTLRRNKISTMSRPASQTWVSQVNSATSPCLMEMTTLSHTASLNFLPRMSSMGLLRPPMVLESSRTVPSQRRVR